MNQRNDSIPVPPAATAAEPRQRPRLMLAVMLLSVFMAVANIFIVNVATPSIQRGLHADFYDVQLVVSAYTLAYAVALIIGGRLGDRYGRRRMLLIGIAGFTLTSLLCGIANSSGMLIAIRVLQGLSAALISPQVLSLIQAQYPPERRGMIFGLYGAAQGLAASTGQLIGGLLLAWNPWSLDWRLVFFFNVPIGLVLLFMVPFVSESRDTDRTRMDWYGAAIAAAGLLLLVYPLVQGQKLGWPALLIISLILSVPVLAVFVWTQRRLLASGRRPFMNVRLFGQKSFSLGLAVIFLMITAQSAFFLIMAYLLQMGHGFTALKSGLIILPLGLAYFLASLLSPKLAGRIGAYVLTVGAVMTFIGYLALGFSVWATGWSPNVWLWLPALTLLGAGQGFVASPLTNVVLSKVEKQDIGSASGILTTGMQLASAIGIGLIGIVWMSSLGHYAGQAEARTELQLRQNLAAYALTEEQGEGALAGLRECLSAGSGGGQSVAAGCTNVAVAGSGEEKLIADGVSQTNMRNYTSAFTFSMYVLGLYTMFMIPMTIALAGRKRQNHSRG
ncbi:MFS transporter [Paenibacillus terreus]|uniref:MFS transporter n=1 Tax=Paenibacillus terreus TaxID=1387834 RepID=A0ABV5B312_9BACL